MMAHPYQQQSVLLASQHHKEQAIAPAFETHLGCRLVVHPFDTDRYGTFTGEIARPGTQQETLLRKAKDAAEHFQQRLVIASEGSFGPHPDYPWIAGGVEMMVFMDLEQTVTLVEQQVITATNYAHLDLHPGDDYKDFLVRVGFPTHGLVVRSLPALTLLAKGVTDMQGLRAQLRAGFSQYAQLRLETDMRAHLNPTRMQSLVSLADQLARRVATLCAVCGCPGFGLTAVRGQLPCEACAAPTRLYQYQVMGCQRCAHEQALPRPDHQQLADPRYCDFCNP